MAQDNIKIDFFSNDSTTKLFINHLQAQPHPNLQQNHQNFMQIQLYSAPTTQNSVSVTWQHQKSFFDV